MITIHFDFTDGTEISYIEGLKKKDDFTTCCLEFFNMDLDIDEVLVVRKTGKTISRKNIQAHTQKEIRAAHNIRKILLSGGFSWL